MAGSRSARPGGPWWRWLEWLLPLGIFLLPVPGLGQDDLWSQVRIEGEWVWIDIGFSVQATRAQVWEVLTDFEHMASFISNLEVSSVVARAGPVLQVSQKGMARRGLLAFPFDVVREIHLTPMSRIESHLLRGSMKKQEGVTELDSEGEQTRVVFHGASVPGVWIPPVVGKGFIEREIREQFQELRAEILRRQGQAGTGPRAGQE